jgi:hypothetical protein
MLRFVAAGHMWQPACCFCLNRVYCTNKTENIGWLYWLKNWTCSVEQTVVIGRIDLSNGVLHCFHFGLEGQNWATFQC